MTNCPTCGNALASSPETARDRAERRVAELQAAGLHTLGDIERAQSSGERPTGHVSIAHDGFAGDIIGHYETREGKRGIVVQQDGTRVVHVYGERWLFASAPATGGE